MTRVLWVLAVVAVGCVGDPPVKEVTCGMTKTDTRSDPLNCGGCGNACAPGDQCVASGCRSFNNPRFSIIVTPMVAELVVGQTLEFSAEVKDPSGRTVNTPVAWSSSRPDLLSIDGGLAEALAPGSVSIFAAASGAGTIVPLTVYPELLLEGVSPDPLTPLAIDSPITINFSAPVDPAFAVGNIFMRVQSTGVDLELGGSVTGNSVTIFPSQLLREFGTTYVVTVGSVRGLGGERVREASSEAFTTELFSPNYFYQLNNLYQPGLRLDSADSNGGYATYLAPPSGLNGQQWFFEQLPANGRWVMHNALGGSGLGLEAADGTIAAFLSGPASPGVWFGGQQWNIGLSEDGATLRIKTGDGRSLDTIPQADGGFMPSIQPTAGFSGQLWTIARTAQR